MCLQQTRVTYDSAQCHNWISSRFVPRVGSWELWLPERYLESNSFTKSIEQNHKQPKDQEKNFNSHKETIIEFNKTLSLLNGKAMNSRWKNTNNNSNSHVVDHTKKYTYLLLVKEKKVPLDFLKFGVRRIFVLIHNFYPPTSDFVLLRIIRD